MASDLVTLSLGITSFLGLMWIGVWRHHSGLETKWGDDFYDFHAYRWSEFSSDLGELINEVNQKADFDPDQQGEPIPPEGEIVTVIDDDIGRGRMADIEDALRNFDQPDNLKTEARENYQEAYRLLGLSTIIGFTISGLLSLKSPSSNIENFTIFLAMIIGYMLLATIVRLHRGYKKETQLDELIDEYRSPAS
jgi:hypothetical protein